MNKERITAFMDAVIAIIMTILVLELDPPEQLSWDGFWDMRQSYFSYALSFFWLGTLWISLHMQWYRVKKVNLQCLWAAIIMLFFASLFPYSTSIVDTHFNNEAAQVFYGVVVFAVSMSNWVMYNCLAKANKDDPVFLKQISVRHKVFSLDMGIKIIGLILTLTVFAPAMSFAVLAANLVIIVQQVFASRRAESDKKAGSDFLTDQQAQEYENT